MSPLHLLLALLVAAIWGCNFVFIHLGLQGVPPLLLTGLRFLLAAFPAIFFLPRPRASWRLLLGYGFFTFALQFGFLFSGMKAGMPAGLSSLVMQFQVFFTMGLAAIFLGDKPSTWKISGALISFLGLILVGLNSRIHGSGWSLVLVLAASLSWASGNILSKKIGPTHALGLVVWGSLVACPFLIAASLLIEGPSAIISSLSQLSLISGISLFYIVYLSTHVAYSLWSFLLNQYPTAVIAPFTLLVPVFGFLGSAIVLRESFPAWKIAASGLVILGLGFNLLEKPLRKLLSI